MRRNLSSFIIQFRSVPPRKYPSHTNRALISTAMKPYQNNSNPLSFYNFPTHATYFGSSNHQKCARFSTQSCTQAANPGNQLEVEIISEEFIKPATPTPQHLKIHEFSYIDQLYPNMYTPFVYFYPNNPKNGHPNLTLKLLKQSLAKTLVRFYPLAGRTNKDKTSIYCNDDGVQYIEATVNDRLSDFLDNRTTDNKSVHRLLPLHPDSKEFSSRTDIAIVQVTTFTCGGIAIGLCPSHHILDAYSIATFFKAWAATVRGAHEEICPTFIASSIFPPPGYGLNGNSVPVVPLFPHGIKSTTKRFVFPASSLATLKAKTGSSRAMSVIGLLARCHVTATAASSKTKPAYTSLTTAVNVRDKISLPPYCVGNLLLTNPPILCSGNNGESLGVGSIVDRLKDSINKVNGDLINKMKDVGFTTKSLKELKKFYSDNNGKHIFMTSACNIGMYEVDFGWGGPIWMSFGLADAKLPTTENFVVLMDTRSGSGIEVWMTLPDQDMTHFERDPELLSLASINPSPLHEPVSLIQ